jgi:hypothetical protein
MYSNRKEEDNDCSYLGEMIMATMLKISMAT